MDNDHYTRVKNLREKIMKLKKDDWKSICLCILMPNDENVTISHSGVFFCIDKLSEKSISQIEEYIDHIKTIKI